MRAMLMTGTAVLAWVGGFAGAAWAQDGGEVAGKADVIVVTGTRTEGRTVFDSLAPIDVVDAGTIETTVSDELVDSLAQLVPSFNVERRPLGDGLIYNRPATLRGLSPDQTLVLIDGKRRHRSAFIGNRGAQAVDLARIPSFALERIEILRDGASAQYGSDAIAGVVNLILDTEVRPQIFAQASQYFEGDGAQLQIGAKGGIALGDGFLNATVEYVDSDPTSRSRQRPDAIAFQAANPTLDVPNPVQNWGQPELETLRVVVNAAAPFTDSAEGYAFATFTDGYGISDFNWRNPVSTSAYRTTPLDPAYNLFDIFPAGFTPRFGQDDQDLSFVSGVRGDFTDRLAYDFSASWGYSEIDYFINDTINASLGSASPTDFYAGSLQQEEVNLNADFVYVWETGLAEPVNVAFGAERREETFTIVAGDPASYVVGPLAVAGLPSGSNGFPGYSETQAGEFSQDSLAAYIDVEAEVTDRLTLGAAVRFEDFSEFGETTDYKLSGRFEVAEGLAVRGALSTGFRAPTPAQLQSERTSQGLNSVTLNLQTSGRFNPTGPVADIINARAGGPFILPLEPETSENISLGVAFERGNFGVTVDAYQVAVEDRFSTLGGFTLTDAERAQLQALNVPGGDAITSVSFFQNQFDTETRGVDVVATWSGEVGPGALNLTGAYNWNETEVTREQVATVFNATSQRLFEEGRPNPNASVSAAYDLGKVELLARARYYGEWTDVDDRADVIFAETGDEVFVDLAATYRFTDDVSVRVGAENVFDEYPDEARSQVNRGLIYSRNAPYDTDGGQVYARVDAKF